MTQPEPVEDLALLVSTFTGHQVSGDEALIIVAAWLKQASSYDDDPTGQIGDGIWRTARHLGYPVA